jgi:hypothetical protein
MYFIFPTTPLWGFMKKNNNLSNQRFMTLDIKVSNFFGFLEIPLEYESPQKVRMTWKGIDKTIQKDKEQKNA